MRPAQGLYGCIASSVALRPVVHCLFCPVSLTCEHCIWSHWACYQAVLTAKSHSPSPTSLNSSISQSHSCRCNVIQPRYYLNSTPTLQHPIDRVDSGISKHRSLLSIPSSRNHFEHRNMIKSMKGA
ncbi:hypothetical protein N431DRAFT_151524 [Stipitochalara longipes BDJ]|nr:hypothetical protein N431DRAFT_151524 [Stipitochalara longipes BDJ]